MHFFFCQSLNLLYPLKNNNNNFGSGIGREDTRLQCYMEMCIKRHQHNITAEPFENDRCEMRTSQQQCDRDSLFDFDSCCNLLTQSMRVLFDSHAYTGNQFVPCAKIDWNNNIKKYWCWACAGYQSRRKWLTYIVCIQGFPFSISFQGYYLRGLKGHFLLFD